MILVTFHTDSGLHLGLKKGELVLDVTAAAEATDISVPRTPTELFEVGSPALKQLQALVDIWGDLTPYQQPETVLRLGAPISKPGKILCVGLNYRRHAAESGMKEPEHPILFSKFNNSITGPEDPVSIGGLHQVDYEAELALVIGRRGKNVTEGEALSYVLGYLNANDLSERQLQFLSGQWLVGKTLDGFLPIGPYLVTADEIASPQAMQVRGWHNGELRQNSSTADMIFSVAQIISYASRYMTLEPGDLICTGTPEGVILGRQEKVWMKPGDTFSVEIGPLGRLTNRMTE